MTTEHIWKEFNLQLLNFIKTKVNDTNMAEDILQEVFIKIHLKINSLKDYKKLNSWLFQLTRNTIIDFYRKKKKPQSLDFLKEIIALEDTVQTPNFEKCLLPFIHQLPEKDKDALLKTELGSLSQKDYAAQLGISYSTVKSRIQRAKEKVKNNFISCCKVQLNETGQVIDSDCSC